MRVLFWIIAVPIIAVAMAFAVSNHEPVTIGLWPLVNRIETPLYIAVTGALFFGLLIGLLWGWIGSLRIRSRVRAEARRVEKLTAENVELRDKLTRAESVAHALPPAAPDQPSGTALRHIAGGTLA